MITNHLFRVSLYSLICLGTIGLWMGEDNPWPYIWVVFFAAVAAYAFTDQWQLAVVPSMLSPWLGLAAVAWFVVEERNSYRIDPVLPLGHLVLLFQIILLFHHKKLITYWLLVLTSFLQMVIAALHNNRLGFGILMGLFLGMIVWTMTQFLLLREAERHRAASGGSARTYVWRRSATGTLGSSLVILLVAVLLFLLIPRRGETAWTVAPLRPTQHISGFDERIRLGQLGTILESDEEVMNIRLFDENGQPLRPADELYWRGVALVYYEGGRWERRVDLEPVMSPWGELPDQYVRQEIRLRGVQRDVLFGMWPAYRGQTQSGKPLGKSRLDGTLTRSEGVASGPLQYTVESAIRSDVKAPGELSAGFIDRRLHDELTQVPESLKKPLQEYASRLGLPPADDQAGIARALLQHLQNPDEFDYTLRATVFDPNIDPMLDFLLNRKEGHCEYFASALAMLLRVQGIPARVVNGFKGGDVNELFGPSLVVRQKHAHSWVEVVLRTPDRPEPHWVSLDPTPGMGRSRMVAMVNPQLSLVRQVGDISRQIWSNYILNFNASEQETAVYGPARRMVVEQTRNLIGSAQQLWAAVTTGFNWLAALLSALAMFAFLQVLRLLARRLSSRVLEPARSWEGRRGFFSRLLDGLQRILASWAAAGPVKSPRVAFYDQLLRMLDARGLHKEPVWTPRQFAEHARTMLQQLPGDGTVASIPERLVDRYYRVRFGNAALDPAESAEIGRLLGDLSLALARKE